MEWPTYGQRLHSEGKINTVKGDPRRSKGESARGQVGGEEGRGANTGVAWWGEDLRAPCALRSLAPPRYTCAGGESKEERAEETRRAEMLGMRRRNI